MMFQGDFKTGLVRLMTCVAAAIALHAGQAIAEEFSPANVEFFEKQIRPLFAKYCYECHSTEEANGGLILDTRLGVRKGGDSGPSIVPGKADKSLLIEAVRYKKSRFANAAQKCDIRRGNQNTREVGQHRRARSSQGYDCRREKTDGHEHRGGPGVLVF